LLIVEIVEIIVDCWTQFLW